MAYTTIIGRLGKDPELKFAQSGKAWMPLNVAWSERVRNKAGEWGDGPTVWVSVRVFGKMAENAAESLGTGMLVACTGELKPETWNSDQGEQTVFTMVADSVAPSLANQTMQVAKATPGHNTGPQSGPFAGGNSHAGAWTPGPQQSQDQTPF